MDLFMESDILFDVQDCGCETEAPPAFTLPPPPPPPGFHYLQDPQEDTHIESSSTPLPWTCPVLVSTPEYHQDALFSSVAAGCVAVLLLVLAVVVTVASRRRSPARHYSHSPICRPTPSASKPGPRTPCRASYASLEQSFAVGYFSSDAGCPSPSPTYCSPCSPSPSRVLPATPSSSRMVVRYHTSSRSFSHSLARPHASARTQTAHPHRSPLYRPRLARVMSGQLLVLPGGGASPCLGLKFPGIEMVSPQRAVDNVYSPLPVPSAHTAFVFP
ncbi:uncharacterized protein LOC119580588 [Penaeus monodon]|uniref:uncharacterized protein LOC119580588 n=1 Tax=Penaeus monodon TaxID=6687 RepID=UPI0018A6E082|nr:uncharacterized protein LOC119580588 [Penaeus monodon]